MRRFIRALALLILGIPGALAAQTGLMVVAHGAGPAWNSRVRETVAQVSWPHGPVAIAFLMGAEEQSAGWDSAQARLVREGARGVVVVPLLVSSFGAHYHQIRFLAGELAELPAELARHGHDGHAKPTVPMRVTSALDGAPELGRVLLDRWRALSPADRSRPLVLIAHGPTSDDESVRWITHLDSAAAGIGREGRIPVSIGLLRDDAPAPLRARAIETIHAQVRALLRGSADSVTIMPVLVSSGRIDAVTIPNDLADLPVRYVPAALAPHPALARWIERSAIARLRETP